MFECFDWAAWFNRMPGTDDPELHVTGACKLRSSSITLTLEPGNEGPVDEPDLFVLSLKVDEPEFGDDRITDREVSWSGDAGPNIKYVRIQGGTEAMIEVTEAV